MYSLRHRIARPAPDEMAAYWQRLFEIQRRARELLKVRPYPF